MIIECSHCHAKYQYDEAKFEGKPSKKIRCAKCQQVFEIFNPSAARSESSASAENGTNAPSSAPSRVAPAPKPPIDSTMTRPPRPRTIAGDVALPGGTAERRLDPTAILSERRENPKITGDLRYSLAIIDGPDAGTVFRVENVRTIIGRTGADFALNDSESSRNHAVLDIRGGLILLEDLGSTNGTIMNGTRIEGPVELQNQSEFQIGSTTLMLIITDVD